MTPGLGYVYELATRAQESMPLNLVPPVMTVIWIAVVVALLLVLLKKSNGHGRISTHRVDSTYRDFQELDRATSLYSRGKITRQQFEEIRRSIRA